MPRTITYSEAINEALREEMERDERVVLLGEDVGRMGGIFGVTHDLYERFGPDRVLDTPISEMFIVGGAVGLAITGLRPVAELQFADFIFNAADETYAKMSKWRYMHGGNFTVPMTLRLPEGATGGGGAEHSLCPEAALLAHPGAHIVVPSTPADAKGLLKAAIRDDNPVAFFEHKGLYATRGEVPDGEHLVEIGKADIKREGTDVTVVAWGRMVSRALEAAKNSDASVEVLDTRGLRPLDTDAIFASIEKTGRLVIAQEAPKTGGGASEIAAIVAEEAIDLLDAPIKRVGALDIPLPQNAMLEAMAIPTAAEIQVAIKEVLA
ncbi:alpha-ketoacid dehydrogenase subunit beta [Cryptosporangium phraense]|uniref:Alpha-ketoacid dehydrogenase subunit beta n=1 Tax=Cryptosporangium phraense TaxID=2593070 RepID=A0A545AXU9_9ACTN|nr:alpha-ketoacid dehydrogenase subunit beta [Cryptosporangium phraense]TQS46163.1 alpha-ketoacid dehydrogenase subunit beta [Cryptosporangium phraense]